MRTSRHFRKHGAAGRRFVPGDVCAVILKFKGDDGVCGCAIDTIVRVRSRLSARPFFPLLEMENGAQSSPPVCSLVPSFLGNDHLPSTRHARIGVLLRQNSSHNDHTYSEALCATTGQFNQRPVGVSVTGRCGTRGPHPNARPLHQIGNIRQPVIRCLDMSSATEEPPGRHVAPSSSLFPDWLGALFANVGSGSRRRSATARFVSRKPAYPARCSAHFVWC